MYVSEKQQQPHGGEELFCALTYVGLFVELFDIINPSLTVTLHSLELDRITLTAS